MTSGKVDVVVVGSGAGGGVVAKELAEAGLSVVVFERGKAYTTADFNHSETESQYSTPPAYGPAVFPNPRTFRYNDREEARLVYAGVDGVSGTSAAAGGGAPLAYGAAAWRSNREDFRMKSTYGTIPGSSLEDWPITYDDLEPYYERAEYEIGVSGLAGADPFAEPRKKPYPLPPLPINPQGEIIRDAGLRLGWHPFPPPFAILTQPYRKRMACFPMPLVSCSRVRGRGKIGNADQHAAVGDADRTLRAAKQFFRDPHPDRCEGTAMRRAVFRCSQARPRAICGPGGGLRFRNRIGPSAAQLRQQVSPGRTWQLFRAGRAQYQRPCERRCLWHF